MPHVLVVSKSHHRVFLADRSTQLLLCRFDGFLNRPPCRRSVFALTVPESLWFDKPVSMQYSGIFTFPCSLRVGSFLGFQHGECMTESSLLTGSSSDWSCRHCLSFGMLSRNEIRLSSRVPISPSFRGNSTSLTSSLEIRMEFSEVGEGMYHDADSSNTTPRLTRAITLLTLLLVRVADEYVLLRLCV